MSERTLPEQVITANGEAAANAVTFWERPLVSVPVAGRYLHVTPKKLAILGGVGLAAYLLFRGRRRG